jgi:vancomycin resistance protein YoaR
MKRVLLTLSGLLVLATTVLFVAAARYEPVIRPNTFVGTVALGGLTRKEAETRLQEWWSPQATMPLTLECRGVTEQPRPSSARALGLELDIPATLALVQLDSFWESLRWRTGIAAVARNQIEPRYRFDRHAAKWLVEFVETHQAKLAASRAYYRDGQIVRVPEAAGIAVDEDGLEAALIAAIAQGGKGQVPIREGTKRVPDDQLARIADVMSTFTTRFSTRQRTRCANIRLATSLIDGRVLMPGERFSFNDIVGRRTAKSGFQLAGVYRNGRHDVDIGGGICQVSTTLYNAALLSNLKVLRRSNHSMPVPYVPVGRDATVDYGSADLVFENSYDHPIAISAEYRPGAVTFRVLGVRDPDLEVRLIVTGQSSWSRGTKTIADPSVPPGRTKVVEKGSAGHRATTYRVVIRNGVEVKRENLGTSIYRGGTRIVAKNPADLGRSVGRAASATNGPDDDQEDGPG